MKRALLIALILGGSLTALAQNVCTSTPAACVTLTGTIAGANGSSAANFVLNLKPSQLFYIGGVGTVINTTVNCATSVDGSVVELQNPLSKTIVSPQFSGTLSSGNYYTRYTFYDASGNQTLPSPEIVTQLVSTGGLTVAIPTGGLPGLAVGMRVYISSTPGTETLQGSTTGNASFVQSIPLVTGAALPASNNTVCKVVANDAVWPTGTGYTVSMTDTSGNTLPGYPMQWQLMGAGTTINLSNGLPYYHGVTFFPTPIIASPINGTAQSINGPLYATQFNGPIGSQVPYPGNFTTMTTGTSPVYNVQNPAYGATGLGPGYDDTIAIQAAVNLGCAATGIGTVYFPVPTVSYYISSPIVIPPNTGVRRCKIVMEGPQKGNWPNCNGQTDCQRVANSIGTIQDGISGGGDVFQLTAGASQYVSEIEFDNIQIWHPSTTGSAFHLSATASGGTIPSITWNGGTFMNGQYGIIATENGVSGAAFFWLDIANTEMLNQSADSVRLDATGSVTAGPIHIHNNWLLGFTNDGIWANNTNQLSIVDNEISNESGGVGAGAYAFRCPSACGLTTFTRNDVEAVTNGFAEVGGTADISGTTIYQVKTPFTLILTTGSRVARAQYVAAGGVSGAAALVTLNSTTNTSVECGINSGYTPLVTGNGPTDVISDCTGGLLQPKLQILNGQGTCSMSSGACTAQTFGVTYASAPACVCTWTGTGTMTGILKCPSTTTTVTPASSVGSDTAQVNFACFGN